MNKLYQLTLPFFKYGSLPGNPEIEMLSISNPRAVRHCKKEPIFHAKETTLSLVSDSQE